MSRTQSSAEQAIRSVLRKSRTAIYRAIDAVTPYITHRKYMGFDLYYSRGTGLIERIRFLSPKKIYEEELCSPIAAALNKQEGGTFLDIGANIGLISLYVLKHSPKTRILAFEPGYRQRAQLEITVSANDLSERMSVFPYALSDASGIAKFNTSIDDRAVGGDGLLDTGRSNGAKTETVETLTLDEFASRHGIKIDVIKIDIEGAELWALQGGERTIAEQRPTIFFAMSPLNLKAYPYEADDIIAFFHKLNYRITDMKGEPCTPDNFAILAQRDDMFIALP